MNPAASDPVHLGLKEIAAHHPALEPIRMRLLPALARFQALQRPDGSIRPDAVAEARDELGAIIVYVWEVCVRLGQHDLADAFAHDACVWIEAGLHTPPAFDTTAATYRLPEPGAHTFFCGPVITANGPDPRGWFLECFWALRQEPAECGLLERRYPHPKNKCQSTRLIAGSRGFATGNCIVFFPENVATREPIRAQSYAVFFFNKFQKIFETITMPMARRVFGDSDLLAPDTPWRAAALPAETCYRARCVWGYLHDYYHHIGPRPFDAHIRVKTTWVCGLLEEIKVDCQTMLACLDDPEVPFAAEVFTFALLERMLRYPQQVDAQRNFDAATGVLLYEWLRAREALRLTPQGGLAGDADSLAAGLRDLVETITEFERLNDTTAYKDRARSFVRSLLPEGGEGERYALPPRFAGEMGLVPREEVLDFSRLPY